MRSCLALCWLALAASIAAAAELDADVAASFAKLSLAVPTAARVIICHGFGCQRRTEIALTHADHAKIAQLFASTRASAEAERRATAQAVAWFQKRVAPEAGTANAKAYATVLPDASQFDCIDSSTNTTQTMIVLDQLGLLRHHRVRAPVSRPLGWHVIHTTAVLRDIHNQEDWSFDTWTRNNGELPEVMTLAKWLEG